jgi:hypothetical protein
MIRPLYKAIEPFMDVKNGYGYQGVVMYDDENDLVQCAICGKWYKSVASHAVHAHKVDRFEYKLRFGLNIKTALCSTQCSKTQSKNVRAAIADGRIVLQIAKLKRSYLKRKKQTALGTRSIQFQNKSGLCELQMRLRYDVVKKIVGREPKQLDIVTHDHALSGAIVRRFKTINNYRDHLGVARKTMIDYRHYKDLDIIAAFRKFNKLNHRPPTPSDFKRSANGYPHFSTIYDRFGSWLNALSTAGV